MKRVILLAVVLLLSVVLAAAAEPGYEALVDDINLFCSIYHAPEFDVSTASISSSDDYKWSALIKANNAAIDLMLFSKDGGKISSLICACSDESNIIDYLACCCAVVSEYRESLGVIEPFGYILYDYMLSRDDQEATPLVSNGTYCSLKKNNGSYILTIVFQY